MAQIGKGLYPFLGMDETKLLRHRGLCRLRCYFQGHYAWSVDTTKSGHLVLTCDRCGGKRSW